MCCKGLQCPAFSNSWREYVCVRCERERFKSAVPCSVPCVCVCVWACVCEGEKEGINTRIMVCVWGGLVCVHTCLCERVRACIFLVSRANMSPKPPNSPNLQCGCGWPYEQYVYKDIDILLSAVIAMWDTNSCCQIQQCACVCVCVCVCACVYLFAVCIHISVYRPTHISSSIRT